MPSRFRDRFYTRPVARALTSPLGIVLAGAGTAVGLAVGLPVIAAVGIGAAAYAARVAVAIPKGRDTSGIDPFQLEDPWRSYVWQAKRAQRHYQDAVKQAKVGPLQDRLLEIGERVEDGLQNCWQVARSGQDLTQARARLDVAGIMTQLTQLTAGGRPPPGSPLGQTVEALESQLATARRLDQVIAEANDRLRLLDARLDETVARAIELSVRASRADELGGLGDAVESVVSEMEALRVALDETDSHLPAGPAAAAMGPPAATAVPGHPPAAAVPGPTASPVPDPGGAADAPPAPAPGTPAARPAPEPPEGRPGAAGTS